MGKGRIVRERDRQGDRPSETDGERERERERDSFRNLLARICVSGSTPANFVRVVSPKYMPDVVISNEIGSGGDNYFWTPLAD